MGLFNKDGESSKKSMNDIYLEQHGINDLPEEYMDAVRNIVNELSSHGLAKASMLLSFSKTEEQAKVGYLSAIIDQNWILMNQNQQIINELKKLNEK